MLNPAAIWGNVRICAALLLAILLAGCEAGLPSNYQGPDAGELVVSIGARKPGLETAYSLLIRRKQPQAAGAITWLSMNLFHSRPPDFNTATEKGIVEARPLPPGEYEIYNYDIYQNGGMFQRHWRATDDFSIPFTIRPHETTYVGNFLAVPRHESILIAITVFSKGPYFILSDQSARDLPLAARQAELPRLIRKDVGNPAVINSPSIRSEDE